MCNCGHHHDTLIPQIGVITDICTETADVKTFRVEKVGGGKLFEHLPGQCAILSVPIATLEKSVLSSYQISLATISPDLFPSK